MENCCNKIFYDFWIQTVVLLVYGMPGVKKCAESSGWQWFMFYQIWFGSSAVWFDYFFGFAQLTFEMQQKRVVFFSYGHQ